MTSKHVSKSLLARVSSCIRQHHLLDDGDRVIVAVSGGPDSLSLLHLLHGLAMNLHLVAVYIDHGLRPAETPSEEHHMGQVCNRLHVPLFTEKIDVAGHSSKNGMSLEESARLLRYQVLEEKRCSEHGQAIAVGHTADDQAEEFFIRLIRGSGTRGLSGMKPKNGYVIRPLLYEHKGTLERFLEQQGITWSIDSSNRDRRFLRNRIRGDLLPLLENDFNPAIRKNVLRNMDILRVEDHFLEQETKAAFARVVLPGPGGTASLTGDQLAVNIQEFDRLHPAIARRVMEKCCWQMGSRPTYMQIHSLMTLAGKDDNFGEVHLSKGLRAVKGAGAVTFLHPLKNGRLRGSEPPLPPVRLDIPGTGTYQLPEIQRELTLCQRLPDSPLPDNVSILRVDMDRITFPLLLRSVAAGEKFHPCNGPGTRKISRYFNDRKIPAKERPGYPVLWCEDRVVAVPGLQVDHYFRVRQTTNRILQIFWRKTKAG